MQQTELHDAVMSHDTESLTCVMVVNEGAGFLRPPS